MNGQPYPAPQKAPPYGIIAGVLFILCALLNLVQVLSILFRLVFYHTPISVYTAVLSLAGTAAAVLIAVSSFAPKLRALLLAGNVLLLFSQLLTLVFYGLGSTANLLGLILASLGYIGMCVLVVLALVRSPQTAKLLKVICFIPPVILILSTGISFGLYAWYMIPIIRSGAFPLLFTLLRVGLQDFLPCLGMLFAALALAAASGQDQRPA